MSMIPILQRRKLRLREVRHVSQIRHLPSGGTKIQTQPVQLQSSHSHPPSLWPQLECQWSPFFFSALSPWKACPLPFLFPILAALPFHLPSSCLLLSFPPSSPATQATRTLKGLRHGRREVCRKEISGRGHRAGLQPQLCPLHAKTP